MSGLHHLTSLGQQFPHLSGKVMAMSAKGLLGVMVCDSRSSDHLPPPLSHGMCFSAPPGLRVKLSSLHTVFLGKGREVPPSFPLAVGKEPGCTLNIISDVIIQQEKRPGRESKDIVWVQSVFAIFHIGSFYEPSKNKTTAAADSICAMKENNKKKNKDF